MKKEQQQGYVVLCKFDIKNVLHFRMFTNVCFKFDLAITKLGVQINKTRNSKS